MLNQLWNDDGGALLSAEVVLAGTILVIGVMAGLTSARDAVVSEMADLAGAVAWLDQSYTFGGIKAHHVQTYGSAFDDCHDFCDQADPGANFHNSKCLVICEDGPGECG